MNGYIRFMTDIAVNNSCISEGELYGFISSLRDEAGQYLRMISSSKMNVSKLAPLWNFAGAFTFSVTIVTTIGKSIGYCFFTANWLQYEQEKKRKKKREEKKIIRQDN